MTEGYSQRFYFGDFTKGGGQSRSQRTEQSRPYQTQPPRKEEFDREKLRQKIAAITPEEREARRQQKEVEDKKLKELLLAYKTRPFTDDEWKLTFRRARLTSHVESITPELTLIDALALDGGGHHDDSTVQTAQRRSRPLPKPAKRAGVA
jgi:hypothetical protein